jgi:hypothetical protein
MMNAGAKKEDQTIVN